MFGLDLASQAQLFAVGQELVVLALENIVVAADLLGFARDRRCLSLVGLDLRDLIRVLPGKHYARRT